MTTKYFKAHVDDAVRIAVVTAKTEDDIYGHVYLRSDEISKLPEDFASWKRYTTTTTRDGDCAAEIMSRDGE